APYGAPPAPGSAPPPAAPSAVPRSPGVGTGFGRRMDHRVTNVSFQRDESTRQLLVLRYDTAANLEARGITLLRTSEDRVMQANPFPGNDNGCPPPPGWSGF
ncbi:MAG: hypothetical protein J2P37_14975, partial [Ktedonobacteraceae bacterium]|nr:hypothetical protein [Ktedonobacteraceae bacterium]